MFKKSLLLPILFGITTILLVASCDKDFNELGTDIVGDDHFGFENYTGASIKSYNQKLGPIASNNLAVNLLGFYNNPAFGTTEANFVTQIELSSTNPTFNNTVPADYQNTTVLDSVILDIPYFKTFVKKENEISTYRLDSIYGNVASTFKLGIYQSNYFLRDLDPSLSFTEQQAFYTDEAATIESNVLLGNQLNNSADPKENSAFFFNALEHKTTTLNSDNEPVDTRSVPSMRLHLSNAFFDTKILHAPTGSLTDNTVFKNYLRGLYFKVENGAPGHMATLNFKAGKITLYYKEDKKKTVGTTVTFERISKTFILNLTGNTVSLLKNSNENPAYTSAANSPAEASKLYLKGGEGAISVIDLFGAADTYKYVLKVDGSGNAVDEQGTRIPVNANNKPLTGYYFTYTKVLAPNGVSDELDDLRYPLYTELGGINYYSKKNRWMINEANLTFNIVKEDVADPATIEPNRIFVYDLTNRKVVVDYTFDATTSSSFPKLNKSIFGGILLDENGRLLKQKNENGVYTNKGSKYKVRLTNHVRNLINNDSTNVRLGVSVTEAINTVGFSKLRTANSNTKGAPTSSVLSPLGTILYGSEPSVPNDKRLKLEIYYTKPN